MSPRNSAVLLSLPFLFLSYSSAQDTCYWPNGQAITTDNYSPCNASVATGSACCAASDPAYPGMCTTTGLCIGHGGFFYRGGCTKGDFSPVPCATICLQDSLAGSFSNLVYCPDSGQWCCGGEGLSCCDDSDYILDNSPSWGYYYARVEPTSSSSTSPSSSSPTNNGGSGSNLGGSKDNQSSGSNSDLGTILGAAIGAPLGVLAIGVLFWLFWKEKRKSKHLEEEKRQSIYPLVGGQNRQSDYGHDGGPQKGPATYYTDREGEYQPRQQGMDRLELVGRADPHEPSHRASQRRELE